MSLAVLRSMESRVMESRSEAAEVEVEVSDGGDVVDAASAAGVGVLVVEA